MYYLTEDNKIDNEIKNPYAKIKKQSENVFDLIEEGDLVGYGGKRVDQVFRKYGKHLVETFMYMNANNQIKTIYKLNKNGDYIKVWEKKSE